MSLRNAYRSLGIAIIILSAFIDNLSTNAFTIRRTNTSVEADQEFAESSLLEVKTVANQNDINVIAIPKNDTQVENIVSIETTTNTEDKNYTLKNRGMEISTATSDKIDEKSKEKPERRTENTTTMNKEINLETTHNNLSNHSTEISENSQSTTEISYEKQTELDTLRNNFRRNTEEKSIARASIEDTQTSTNTTNNLNNNISEKTIDSVSESNTEIPSTETYSDRLPLSVEVSTSTQLQGTADVVSSTSQPFETTFAPIKEDMTKTSQVPGTETTELRKGQITSDTIVPENSDKTVGLKSFIFTEIDNSTDTMKDFLKTDLEQATLSLEKAFSELSPQEIRTNDLLLVKNTEITETQHDLIATSTEIALEIESTLTNVTPLTSSELSTETSKLETVSSRRAGYLDFSSKTTTDNRIETINSGSDKPYSSVNNTDVHESLFQTNNNSRKEMKDIQRHKVEDTIQEELLKESTLDDNASNNRYRDNHDKLAVMELKPLINYERLEEDSKKVIHETITTNQVSIIDDKLSVKALIQDKVKNASLYTVNPNYKPLKKIEVQPPKPFVRDPDDNSWRNESLSSLGIVFKPKNTSKSFTQVLKNKTVFELNNLLERESSETPELRQRLEKISEKRKSKKKNNLGETIYSDEYEESVRDVNASKPLLNVSTLTTEAPLSTTTENVLPSEKPVTNSQLNATETMYTTKSLRNEPPTTKNLKKVYNILDYYDVTDENNSDDYDAVTLPKIDLKKFTQPLLHQTETPVTPPIHAYTKSMTIQFPERKPTLQYFPPRPLQQTRDYDSIFEKKVNLHTLKDNTRSLPIVSFSTMPTPSPQHERRPNRLHTIKPAEYTQGYNTVNMNRNLYLTLPHVNELKSIATVHPDGNFHRGSYVIKHYRDFINEAIKASDERDHQSFTPIPHRGVTPNEFPRTFKEKPKSLPTEDYDYETQFHKDVLERFVDNFNQNSDRFKVDFPVLYNSSVVHMKTADDGKVVASSRAFLKRLYDGSSKSSYYARDKPYDPNCENITVELSPAYELHYYVPEQEEKEVVEAKTPVSMNYGYRHLE